MKAKVALISGITGQDGAYLAELLLAKGYEVHGINDGVQIVMEAYRLAGQTAIFEENPFEQRLRDALSASQQVQGRTTHYMTVGRHLLGLPPDTTMFL